ncbi:hypothetical protein MHBO_003117, partial [Bonamia ostreae]
NGGNIDKNDNKNGGNIDKNDNKNGGNIDKINVGDCPPILECFVELEGKKEELEETREFLDKFRVNVEGHSNISREMFYGQSKTFKQKKNVLIFEPKKRFEKVGKYTFTVEYFENRNQLKRRIESNALEFTVVPGTPKKLKILEKEKFENLSASNFGNCRLIAKEIDLEICDNFNTPIEDLNEFPDILIKVSSENGQNRNLPKLSYSQKNSKIKNLSVLEKSGDFEGDVFLEFLVHPNWSRKNNSSILNRLSSDKIKFYFSNDSKTVSKQKTLESKYAEVKRSIDYILKKLKPFESANNKNIAQFDVDGIESYISFPRNEAESILRNQIKKISNFIEENKRQLKLPFFDDPLRS